MAKAESILNPKLEISVMRKQTSEVYTVTNDMKILTNRMHMFISKDDSFLVEVKEQILSFEPNSPAIKILVNGERLAPGGSVKGRVLGPKVVRDLNATLKDLGGSSYSQDGKKIVCGQCTVGVKPREKGGARSISKYFKGNKSLKIGHIFY